MKWIFLLFISLCFAEISAIDSHILVVFGTNGDLAQRKLIPALYHLYKDNSFVFVGIGRQKKSQNEFHEDIYHALKKYLPQADFNEQQYDLLIEKCFYFQADLENKSDYENLDHFLNELDSTFKTQENRLFYLSTPPSLFSTILKNLYLTEKSRVLIEKPFGRDLASAMHLKSEIETYLNENQIYLVDHYLGKEVIQNLLSLRVENPLLEACWNHHSIDKVEIILSEGIGIGTRGQFWEETGLLRDVVQNHLLQLIALIAMEQPLSLNYDAICKEKVRVIESIYLDDIIKGQYGPNGDVVGYREEKNVSPNSNIETFVAAKLFIDNERWKGVPFYFRAGKRLAEKKSEIIITFKNRVKLIVCLYPEEIFFSFDSNDQSFKIELPFRKKYLREAYENILQEAMTGNRQLFVSLPEILAAWKLLTPVLEYWEQNPPNNFPNYSAGSWGPPEVEHIFDK